MMRCMTADPTPAAANDQWNLDGATVVITGGNAGIGREAAVELGRRGARVVITARNAQRGADAVADIRRRTGRDDVDVVHMDLASLASVRTAAAEVLGACPRIDVLINNAGGILSEHRLTEDGFEETFAVNHLAHHLFTNLLRERLVASAPARVVTVASLAHRYAWRGLAWDDLQASGAYRSADAYAQSKLANILFTVELAQRTLGTGVTANAYHPGSVRTSFGSADDTRGLERLGIALARPFMVPASRGAEPLVRLAVDPALAGVTGAYFCGGYLPGVHRRTPSSAARDPEAARRLWELSDKLTGLE
jgi:NAD(P)-dependent dehydrogenase (short-subunit alcohol dehydrogenase family)